MYPLETQMTDIGDIPYQEFLSHLLCLVHGAVLVYNKAQHKLYWSREFLSLIEYNAEELSADPEQFAQLQHAGDTSFLNYLEQNSHLTQLPLLSVRLKRKSGFYKRMELRGIQGNESAGTDGKIIFLINEASENRMQKLQARHEEELNNEIYRISKVGGWEIDLKTKKHIWTSGMYHILEITHLPSCEDLTSWLPDEYKPLVKDAIRHIIKNKEARSVEYEINLKSGKRKWLHAKGEPILDKDGNVIKMIGILQDIDEDRKKTEQLQQYYGQLQKTNFLLNEVSKLGKFGLWEADVNRKDFFWSKGIYDIYELPYGIAPGEPVLKKIYEGTDNYNILLQHFNNCVSSGVPYDVQLYITSYKGNQRWIRLTGMPVRNNAGEIIAARGFARDISEEKQKEEELNSFQRQLERNHFILNEAGSMAHVGGWQLDLVTNEVSWTKEIFLIHELPSGKSPSFEEALSFFTPKSRLILKEAIRRTIEYLQSFDLELELITAKKNKIWIRAIGKPVVNEQGNITELRGVFQNITDYKQKEQLLEQNNKVIREQNERLESFAHIVSHNLRSHAATFSASLEAFDMIGDRKQQEEIISVLNRTANNLHETLHHLNEVIKIKTNSKEARQWINFNDVVQYTLEILAPLINKTGAEIKTDFTACPQVEHIPAYLNSIVLNLVSNALKYRSPLRTPVITLTTRKEGNRKILMVADNGLGIDLYKYGNQLFGMYKTFHNHPDAKGVGLFITKSQVEALGGTIEASSKIDTGTLFTVTML